MRNLKRHIALTEKLFPNVLFQIILIFTLNVLFPIICFGENNWWNNGNITIFSLVLSQCIILVLFRILMHYPGNRSVGFIPSSVISVYGCLILFLAIFRLNYSSLFLISSFFMSLLSGFVLYFVTIRFSKKRIAIIPLGNIQNLEKNHHCRLDKIRKTRFIRKNL